MKYYTGVGSRDTPPDLMPSIADLARFLCNTGYVLRSGGASGADSFFESAVTDASKKEIYLPWSGFNGNKSTLCRVKDEALTTASKFHPAWDKLSYGARKLMGRNCYQVLGFNLKTPSEFLVCWTKNGKLVGGTSLAMKLAESHGIPVYNLFFEGTRDKLKSWISSGRVSHD